VPCWEAAAGVQSSSTGRMSTTINWRGQAVYGYTNPQEAMTDVERVEDRTNRTLIGSVRSCSKSPGKLARLPCFSEDSLAVRVVVLQTAAIWSASREPSLALTW
jgi:hypothetical protein